MAMNLLIAHGHISKSDIEYSSTGIGDENRADEISEKLNLKIIFAPQGSGEYLSDVGITIENSKGTKILETISPGPPFYVALPPGHYRLKAQYKGVVIRKTFSIKDKKRQVSYFYWPAAT